jgi:hypothetical protein
MQVLAPKVLTFERIPGFGRRLRRVIADIAGPRVD